MTDFIGTSYAAMSRTVRSFFCGPPPTDLDDIIAAIVDQRIQALLGPTRTRPLPPVGVPSPSAMSQGLALCATLTVLLVCFLICLLSFTSTVKSRILSIFSVLVVFVACATPVCAAPHVTFDILRSLLAAGYEGLDFAMELFHYYTSLLAIAAAHPSLRRLLSIVFLLDHRTRWYGAFIYFTLATIPVVQAISVRPPFTSAAKPHARVFALESFSTGIDELLDLSDAPIIDSSASIAPVLSETLWIVDIERRVFGDSLNVAVVPPNSSSIVPVHSTPVTASDNVIVEGAASRNLGADLTWRQRNIQSENVQRPSNARESTSTGVSAIDAAPIPATSGQIPADYLRAANDEKETSAESGHGSESQESPGHRDNEGQIATETDASLNNDDIVRDRPRQASENAGLTEADIPQGANMPNNQQAPADIVPANTNMGISVHASEGEQHPEQGSMPPSTAHSDPGNSSPEAPQPDNPPPARSRYDNGPVNVPTSRWQLELVYKGAVTKVYTVRCTISQRIPCIVKRYDWQHRGFGLYEIECLKRVTASNHPNIVGLIGYRVLSGNAGLDVHMEYLRGGDLHAFRKQISGKNGWLSKVDCKAIATQIARGLQHIHSMGMVHADIKPQNIGLVCCDASSHHDEARARQLPMVVRLQRNAVKIFDLGNAELSPGPHEHVNGSPLYEPPEGALGLRWSYAYDSWSYALTLLEICTSAEHPFNIDLFEEPHPFIFLQHRMHILLEKPVPEHMVEEAVSKHPELADWFEGKTLKDKLSPALRQYFKPLEYYFRNNRSLLSLIERLLEPDPSRRATMQEVLEHDVCKTSS